jgi:RND family efflux transporter MFP subunit
MRRSYFIALFALILVVGIVAFGAWPKAGRNGDVLKTVETAQVSAASFYITLPVQGTLEAARSVPIVNIARDTQIVSASEDGVRVAKGDVVLKLNPTEAQKQVDDLKQQVADAEEKVSQAKADGAKRVQNAESGLAKAKESLDLAQTQSKANVEKAQAEVAFLEKELAVAQGQLDKRQRLYEEHLVPITEVESSEDELRAKTFSLEAAKRSLERAQSDAETNERLRRMELQTAELELEQAHSELGSSILSAERGLLGLQEDLQDAQEQLDAMEVKAPVEGMLLLDQTWEDGWRPLRVGDQVWEGQRVANVIDPSEMWVRCDINEADIERVKVGQPALVRVPAIGQQELSGKVRDIDNLARQRSPWEGGIPGKNVFAAVIVLTTEEPRLRPGMGATVEIVLDAVDKGLAVPREALFAEGKNSVVYRAQDAGFRAVPVEVLKQNNAEASVKGEIKEGETIALRRPPSELIIRAEGAKR